MSKRHIAILFMLTCASSFALIWGEIRAQSATGTMVDYQVVYIGARCLIQHCDPYSEADVLRLYFAEGGVHLPEEPGKHQHYLVAEQLYPPTAEIFFAPFGALSWPLSYHLWVALTFILMTASAFLMWDAAQQYAPDPPFYLACILLANTGILFASANPAGVAISLCIIAVWCIGQQRLVVVGVLALAISLAIKPHDSGAVWLSLLLFGGAFRKRALQVLSTFVAFAAVAIVWVHHISPNWFQEMRSNILGYSTNGSRNDPAGATMMINLQPVIAVIRNDPHFYNFVSYAVFALFLVVWIVITLRTPISAKGRWMALAAMSACSLLPLYHRGYDAKILLLTLPACAALWAEGSAIRWMAFAFTAGGILVTSDLPTAALDILSSSLSRRHGTADHILYLMITRPAGMVLLALGIFYLWAYARQARRDRISEGTAKQVKEQESALQQ